MQSCSPHPASARRNNNKTKQIKTVLRCAAVLILPNIVNKTTWLNKRGWLKTEHHVTKVYLEHWYRTHCTMYYVKVQRLDAMKNVCNPKWLMHHSILGNDWHGQDGRLAESGWWEVHGLCWSWCWHQNSLAPIFTVVTVSTERVDVVIAVTFRHDWGSGSRPL